MREGRMYLRKRDILANIAREELVYLVQQCLIGQAGGGDFRRHRSNRNVLFRAKDFSVPF
jgi:hypothetical protein